VIFDIRPDLNELKKFATDMQRKRVPAVAARAINKTLGNVRTEASKQIREERTLKANVVRDALTISRASRSRLIGALYATGRPIPLRDYAARQTKKGVTVSVTRGQRKRVSHAGNAAFFVGRLGGNVFAREGKGRLPIKKLFGPSIPSTFVKDKVIAALDRVGRDAWRKRFAEEWQFELGKLRG
jgi:hypothetical protein